MASANGPKELEYYEITRDIVACAQRNSPKLAQI
jgi:hypothetical protein